MGRENDRVLAFEGIDAVADFGVAGIGHRHQAGDDAHGLGIFDDAFGMVLFDDAHGFGAQRVAQDAVQLEALARPAGAIAQPAFIHAHIGEAGKGLFVGQRPAHCLDQPIHPRLVVIGNLFQGDARARNQILDGLLLFLGDATHCHDEFLICALRCGSRRVPYARIQRNDSLSTLNLFHWPRSAPGVLSHFNSENFAWPSQQSAVTTYRL